MIDKEFQAVPAHDRLQKAGNIAEQQMAHYLKRAFGYDDSVHVFNNLRFEQNGEVAQIDHLIFHRAGFILVESKSVTSAVRINQRDEWARLWNDKWQGMASPLLQAQRQADLLRAFLQAHKLELRNKFLFGLKQSGFSGFLMDVVVAISDNGMIEYEGQLPDVKKADQIPEHIKSIIKTHNRAASLVGGSHNGKVGVDLKPEEVERICKFLLEHHKEKPVMQEKEAAAASAISTIPQEPQHEKLPEKVQQEKPVENTASAPVKQPTDKQQFHCSKCHSSNLQIQFGKSYYFKCLDCSGNTAIHLTCKQCGHPARTRKQGKEFFAECQNGHSERYFVNPSRLRNIQMA